MFGDTENIIELARGLPSSLCLLLIVPLILISPLPSAVSGVQDFPAFRMQQYDLGGVKYGSRSATINLEARSLKSENLLRRCAIVRASEFSVDNLMKAVEGGLSGLLILIPVDLDTIIDHKALELHEQLEQRLLEADLPIPVYFARETDDMSELYNEVSQGVTTDEASSALKALSTVALVNSFHLITDVSESKEMTDFPIISLQGKLSGQGLEDQLPTIAIVAHYDSFSSVPNLSVGADSSASGVVALLEISRLFSKLYKDQKTHPKYNLLFLLAGGGKFNFQGTKKWIEENIESSEISLLSEVEYVLCLDAIGQGDNLNLHVSRPPKEGSQGYQLFKDLQQVAGHLYPGFTVEVVHKKVNLADDILPWEHERFSLRRLPAGTLSHRPVAQTSRGSIFDKKVDNKVLARNVKVICEGLARHIYNLTGKGYPKDIEIFSGELAVSENYLQAWTSELSSQPRAQQLISKDSKLISSLEETLSRDLSEVRRVLARADKKDPEFLFYDVFEAKFSVYSVKPALFDLFLAVWIVAYLAVIYLFIEKFPALTELMPKHSMANGKMSNGKVANGKAH